MHLLLTDRLACPRCGPEFGLILLADRLEDRRVLEGRLGCPNCRDHFPVVDGFGDLRAPPRTALDEAAGSAVGEGREGAPTREETVRLAALLGVAEGPGHLALLGDAVRFAEALADLLDGVEVVALGPGLRRWLERTGVSRLVARPGLPFFSGSLRGVALGGEGPMLAEAVRVTAPTGRVVVLDAAPGTRAELEDAGLAVLLDEGGVVVGTRAAGGRGPSGRGVALPVFPGPSG